MFLKKEAKSQSFLREGHGLITYAEHGFVVDTRILGCFLERYNQTYFFTVGYSKGHGNEIAADYFSAEVRGDIIVENVVNTVRSIEQMYTGVCRHNSSGKFNFR